MTSKGLPASSYTWVFVSLAHIYLRLEATHVEGVLGASIEDHAHISLSCVRASILEDGLENSISIIKRLQALRG